MTELLGEAILGAVIVCLHWIRSKGLKVRDREIDEDIRVAEAERRDLSDSMLRMPTTEEIEWLIAKGMSKASDDLDAKVVQAVEKALSAPPKKRR